MKASVITALAASVMFTTLNLAGPAWALNASVPPVPASAPGPEMSAGALGMMLAAGAVYLIKRRNRQFI